MPTPKKLPKWAWIGAVLVGLVVAYFVLRKSGTALTGGDTQPQDATQPLDPTSGGGGGGSGSAGSFPPVPVVQEPTTNNITPASPQPTPTPTINPATPTVTTGGSPESFAISQGYPLVSSTDTISASMQSPSGINVVPDIAPQSGAINPLTGGITMPTIGAHGIFDQTIGHVQNFTSPVLQRVQAGREQRLQNPPT